jgi:thiol:disulfide interchange protein
MKGKLVRYSFVFAVLIAVASAYAFTVKAPVTKNISTEKGINFIEQDWNKALQQAKENKKLVFLDIYATWCGPCKMLKKNTFTDEAAGKFFNENFINVSIDGEAGVGPELAQRFNIIGYPTLIIADADGNVVLQTAGYVDADYLINFAKEALKRKS